MTSTLESAAVVGIIIASAVGTFILVVLIVCCCHKHRSTTGSVIRHLQQLTSMTTRQPTCQTASYPQPVVHGALHQWAYNSPPEVGVQSYPPYMVDSKDPGGSGGFMEVGPLEPTGARCARCQISCFLSSSYHPTPNPPSENSSSDEYSYPSLSRALMVDSKMRSMKHLQHLKI